MPSHPSPATARTRAGAPPVSVAALVSLGALHPAPAAAASSPAPSPHATAAVLDLDGAGRTPVVHGQDAAYDTAGIVKVDILAALLLRAQDAGHGLTAEERGRARPMIERSDNSSADALWRRIGRASGLAAANKRLGLTSKPGSTAQSAALNAQSRTCIRTLMGQVVPEQTWGVPAADGSGSARGLKNGLAAAEHIA